MEKTHIACGIMINNNGHVLMGKRSTRGTHPGIWEFPGGKQEDGETIHECLKREWKEELNLDIHICFDLCNAKIPTSIASELSGYGY